MLLTACFRNKSRRPDESHSSPHAGPPWLQGPLQELEGQVPFQKGPSLHMHVSDRRDALSVRVCLPE